MIFDTHAHYDSEQFDEDRETLPASMKKQAWVQSSMWQHPMNPASKCRNLQRSIHLCMRQSACIRMKWAT